MNFYREAATVLDRLKEKSGSLKSLVFRSNATRSLASQRRLYALLSETLKQKDALERVLETSQLLKIERKMKISHSLALVLVYDLLCSKHGIEAAQGPIKDALLRHKTRLKSEYVKANLSKSPKFQAFVPRWVRVNIIKTSLEEVIKKLDQLSLIRVSDLERLKVEKQGYFLDVNVQNLLAFHPSYPLSTTFAQEYDSGKIILQDKASCIPAELLGVMTGATVLDACAAPGNKTTQIAASVGKTGFLFAVERDVRRAETLKNMIVKAGASEFTSVLNVDFTELNLSDRRFSEVTHILLDPSCSGSGLDRLDYDSSDSNIKSRLRKLATFQIRLLKHALSFPSVEKVVYSTCSVHAEENERVVRTVLQDIPGWKVLGRDEQPKGLRDWPRRGLLEECKARDIAEGCIRCEKGVDGTIGFFAVALTRDIISVPELEEGEWEGIW